MDSLVPHTGHMGWIKVSAASLEPFTMLSCDFDASIYHIDMHLAMFPMPHDLMRGLMHAMHAGSWS